MAGLSAPIALLASGPAGANGRGHGGSCYSYCPSRTTLTVSPDEVTYGDEQAAVITATVAPRVSGSAGTPTGTVTVRTGWTTLCTITLSGGTGTCSPTASALRASRRPYLIFGDYSGDSSYGRGWSDIAFLRVDEGTEPPPPPHHHHHGPGWPWNLADD